MSLLFAAMLAFACSTNNQSEIMRAQFERHFEAHNDHDIDKALSFLSDDFKLHFTEYDVEIDKKGLVDVLGWDKGVNGKVSYKNLVVNGDSISGLFTERNDFLRLIGIEQLQANITYRFDDSGMIVRQSYTPLPNQPSVQDKLQGCIEWARANRPEELKEIYPQSQMQFNQQMAERWVTLLQEWHVALRDQTD